MKQLSRTLAFNSSSIRDIGLRRYSLCQKYRRRVTCDREAEYRLFQRVPVVCHLFRRLWEWSQRSYSQPVGLARRQRKGNHTTQTNDMWWKRRAARLLSTKAVSLLSLADFESWTGATLPAATKSARTRPWWEARELLSVCFFLLLSPLATSNCDEK